MNAFSDVIDLEFKFYDSKAHGGETNLMNAQNLNSDSVLLKKLRNFRSIDGYTSDKSDVKEKSRAIVGCGVSLGSTFVKLLADEGKLFVAHNTAGP